jgi:hypothetical protein
MNKQDTDDVESDDQELSDFHRDYLIRYMEVELERQERASASFLKERASRLVPAALKAPQNQS